MLRILKAGMLRAKPSNTKLHVKKHNQKEIGNWLILFDFQNLYDWGCLKMDGIPKIDETVWFRLQTDLYMYLYIYVYYIYTYIYSWIINPYIRK